MDRESDNLSVSMQGNYQGSSPVQHLERGEGRRVRRFVARSHESLSAAGKKGAQARSHESRVLGGRKAAETRGHESLSAAGRKGAEARTHESRVEGGRKAAETRGYQSLSEAGRKGGQRSHLGSVSKNANDVSSRSQGSQESKH